VVVIAVVVVAIDGEGEDAAGVASVVVEEEEEEEEEEEDADCCCCGGINVFNAVLITSETRDEKTPLSLDTVIVQVAEKVPVLVLATVTSISTMMRPIAPSEPAPGGVGTAEAGTPLSNLPANRKRSVEADCIWTET